MGIDFKFENEEDEEGIGCTAVNWVSWIDEIVKLLKMAAIYS